MRPNPTIAICMPTRYPAGYRERSWKPVERDVRGATAAHANLLTALATSDRRPGTSRVATAGLDGWSRAHAHRSQRRQQRADARRGEPRRGRRAVPGRNRATQRRHRARVRPFSCGVWSPTSLPSCAELEAAWARTTPTGWQGTGQIADWRGTDQRAAVSSVARNGRASRRLRTALATRRLARLAGRLRATRT